MSTRSQEITEAAPRSARYMTFGELLVRPRSTIGTCRFCNAWHVAGQYYGARHAVCVKCCETRCEETLPSVLKSERAARSYANRVGEPVPAKLISTLAGVTLPFAEWVLAHRKSQDAKTDGRGISL